MSNYWNCWSNKPSIITNYIVKVSALGSILRGMTINKIGFTLVYLKIFLTDVSNRNFIKEDFLRIFQLKYILFSLSVVNHTNIIACHILGLLHDVYVTTF
jgi:hypothetical protein